jgi:hypothetical protein
MAQITHGIVISAAPGAPLGTAPSIVYLVGNGAPAVTSNPQVATAAVGSLYTDAVSGLLYVNQLSGGWTQK